jgi:ferritin-like metal-binding protein YciE
MHFSPKWTADGKRFSFSHALIPLAGRSLLDKIRSPERASASLVLAVCVEPPGQDIRLLRLALNANGERTAHAAVVSFRAVGSVPTRMETKMASTAKDLFVTGLRNAHAMETQARELMERQSERLVDYPEVKARMQGHLRETEEQLRRLDQCLSSLGETASTIKDTAQSFMGNMMAMAHSVADDEILKNTFANNAFENFEIAAYKSLLALCGPAGADITRTLLEQSLKEEEAMASWVDQNVAKVTLAYLNKAERAAA